VSEHHLVALDADHPGFRDPVYRRRRDAIARQAVAHRTGEPVADVAYSDDEQGVWQAVWQVLHPLHVERVHPQVQRYQDALALRQGPIPQFSALNRDLAATGFALEPVAGLVSPAEFLHALADGVFCATQYMRHASKPLYTPEPDVVHELVGHGAGLLHPELARLNRAFGVASLSADEAQMWRILRVYWWSIEFGLVREADRVLAVGAGLLSSAGELAGALDGPELLPWDLDVMAETPFDPSSQNAVLFVAPSWEAMVSQLAGWLEGMA